MTSDLSALAALVEAALPGVAVSPSRHGISWEGGPSPLEVFSVLPDAVLERDPMVLGLASATDPFYVHAILGNERLNLRRYSSLVRCLAALLTVWPKGDLSWLHDPPFEGSHREFWPLFAAQLEEPVPPAAALAAQLLVDLLDADLFLVGSSYQFSRAIVALQLVDVEAALASAAALSALS